jgi:hypothetical protein
VLAVGSLANIGAIGRQHCVATQKRSLRGPRSSQKGGEPPVGRTAGIGVIAGVKPKPVRPETGQLRRSEVEFGARGGAGGQSGGGGSTLGGGGGGHPIFGVRLGRRQEQLVQVKPEGLSIVASV